MKNKFNSKKKNNNNYNNNKKRINKIKNKILKN